MGEGATGKADDMDILEAIRDHYAPAVGSKDLASELGVTRQAIHSRLQRFEHEKGWVESDKVGGSRIWWLTTDGRKEIHSQ